MRRPSNRLSKELLSDADIDVGDVVDVAVQEGSIVVTPVRTTRRFEMTGRSASWLFMSVFLVALSLHAMACGGNHDPFVGTWDAKDSGTRVIVGNRAGQYVVTFVPLGTWGHAERNGAVLHLWAGAKPQVGKEMYLTYQPGSGELLLTDPAGPGVHILFHRVSDSPAVPSPLPGRPSSFFAP